MSDDRDTTLYVYSTLDLEDIMGDTFVELREQLDSDDDAATAVEVAFENLTDEFYAHFDEQQ